MFWLLITATTHVAADLKSIVDSMVASYVAQFGANLSNSFAQTAAKATWLYASGNALEYAGSYANTFSVSGGVEPDAVCAVANWAIADYYRGGHPRTYLPGVPTANVTNGRNVGSGFQTNIATAGNNFITAVNALTHGGISAVALGTVRFASGNAWLSPPVFRAYSSCSCRSVLGTQRRRYAV